MKRLLIAAAAALAVAVPVGADSPPEMPEKFSAAVTAIEKLGSYSAILTQKRPLPLTQNLAREQYELVVETGEKGKSLSLKGLSGPNAHRVFACDSPCSKATVTWPGRPPVEMVVPSPRTEWQGDPRLHLAPRLEPAAELRRIGTKVESRVLEIKPLIKLNRTRYTYRLKLGGDYQTFFQQYWGLSYNENNTPLVQLTVDNKSMLPTQLRVTQRKGDDADDVVLVFDKWWKFTSGDKIDG